MTNKHKVMEYKSSERKDMSNYPNPDPSICLKCSDPIGRNGIGLCRGCHEVLEYGTTFGLQAKKRDLKKQQAERIAAWEGAKA